MNDFLSRIRSALARFMYGRNGVDQLCLAMLASEFALYFAGLFVRAQGVRLLLRLLSLALAALVLWRMFSRDLARRRAENARFLCFRTSWRGKLRGFRDRRADKAHKYVKCACGAWCRVPRGVGRVELICPKCGGKQIVKT